MEANEGFDKMGRSENDMFLQMYNNNTTEEKGELIKRLHELDATLINNDQELRGKLFDFNFLDENKMPKIVTPDNAVIIFDNVSFNSTYLIDLVIEAKKLVIDYFEKSESKPDHNVKAIEMLKNVKFYYCNNPFTRAIVFNGKNYDKDKLSSDYKKYEIENLTPSLMYVNKTTNDIRVMEEPKLSTIPLTNVVDFLDELIGYHD